MPARGQIAAYTSRKECQLAWINASKISGLDCDTARWTRASSPSRGQCLFQCTTKDSIATEQSARAKHRDARVISNLNVGRSPPSETSRSPLRQSWKAALLSCACCCWHACCARRHLTPQPDSIKAETSATSFTRLWVLVLLNCSPSTLVALAGSFALPCSA